MSNPLRERDDEDVQTWMRQLAAAPIEGSRLPDPTHLWWKAELLRRWDQQRRAAEPIERAEPLQVAIGLVGAVVLLAWLWHVAPTLPASSSTIVGVVLVGGLMVVAMTLVAFGSLFVRD